MLSRCWGKSCARVFHLSQLPSITLLFAYDIGSCYGATAGPHRMPIRLCTSPRSAMLAPICRRCSCPTGLSLSAGHTARARAPCISRAIVTVLPYPQDPSKGSSILCRHTCHQRLSAGEGWDTFSHPYSYTHRSACSLSLADASWSRRVCLLLQISLPSHDPLAERGSHSLSMTISSTMASRCCFV